MKKLLLLTLAACLPFSMVMAAPDPANFHIVYGNVDGSAISVGLDKDIEVPVWGATAEPASPDIIDSVSFVHMPLMTDDLYITARTGGFFPAFGVGLWDDRSFLPPDTHANDPIIPVGFTSQSVLGFAYLTDPRDPQNFIWTQGAYQLLATFRMHTANDAGYIGQYFSALSQGHNGPNGGLLWGMSDGVNGVIPTQVYCQLYFSPNQAPVWNPAPVVSAIANVPFTFQVVGTDIDLGNTLTITYVGPGTFTTVQTSGAVETITGTWSGMILGPTTFHFVLDDGSGANVPLDVVVTPGPNALSFGDGTCIPAFPGMDVFVPVYLNTAYLVGGFDLVFWTDMTALTYAGIVWEPAIFGGMEYHNQVMNPVGYPAGSQRLVWIANVNDGHDQPPAAIGNKLILTLQYHVASGLPFATQIDLTWLNQDFRDNTTSDETGYELYHPVLTDGCVIISDYQAFRGDPNMNCLLYEIADAVLVARRLIEGYIVWSEDDAFGASPDCSWDTHFVGNDGMQEAAADLNGNGFADVADLVRFINIINGYITPKLDPISGQTNVYFNNGTVTSQSGSQLGAVLVRIAHTGEIGTPVAANGMDILSQDNNGVLSVLVYSLAGQRIPAGTQTLFTVNGTGTISEVSASDANGTLLDAVASLGAPLPTQFGVDQNYPNPFNVKTLINFALPTESDVTVSIYSITGQLVETLNGHFAAGQQSMIWDAANVTSGVYFAKVSNGSDSRTLKMTLLK